MSFVGVEGILYIALIMYSTILYSFYSAQSCRYTAYFRSLSTCKYEVLYTYIYYSVIILPKYCVSPVSVSSINRVSGINSAVLLSFTYTCLYFGQCQMPSMCFGEITPVYVSGAINSVVTQI